MIHIHKNKLIIELDHEETLKDLKLSIARVLQAQFINPLDPDEDLTFANFQLLDLLIQLIKQEH